MEGLAGVGRTYGSLLFWTAEYDGVAPSQGGSILTPRLDRHLSVFSPFSMEVQDGCPQSSGMNYVAIVGHAADKFTPKTEELARAVIREILTRAGDATLISGGCHLGGVDIFAEEEADKLGLDKEIFLPKSRRWNGGYKERNILIAESATEAHCVVVEDYPEGYTLPRYGSRHGEAYCYHCDDDRPTHVKSGGCWTVMKAEAMGAPAEWHIV